MLLVRWILVASSERASRRGNRSIAGRATTRLYHGPTSYAMLGKMPHIMASGHRVWWQDERADWWWWMGISKDGGRVNSANIPAALAHGADGGGKKTSFMASRLVSSGSTKCAPPLGLLTRILAYPWKRLGFNWLRNAKGAMGRIRWPMEREYILTRKSGRRGSALRGTSEFDRQRHLHGSVHPDSNERAPSFGLEMLLGSLTN